ncbi:MAG: RNA polymerase sigma factor [Defluviitaleaceae bacterium]|nr:RNA polymerase sigma factor [Defluviitaleaceae bacterium]
MEDFLIVEMFFERKEAAIDEARQKYGKRMFRISHNILHSNEDAEECVSDTLLKAWGVIPPNRPTMLGAFLAKITRNLSINRWEAGRAAKRGGGETNLLLDELGDCIPSKGGRPEVEYEASLVSAAINDFLQSIDQQARMAFVLRYFHGESIRDISERFKVSESKIKSILFRTRKKLSAHLEKEGILI